MKTPMKTPRSLTALAAVAALLGLSCAEDDPPPRDPVAAWLADTWGITTSGFEGWDGTQFEVLDDGTAVARGEGTIHVEGLGSEAVTIDEEVEPQSRGGATSVFLGVPGSEDALYVRFEPVRTRLAFGDASVELGVDANPDGTFHVWRHVRDSDTEETLAVTDGPGVYQHVEANGGLEDDSPYLLLMAFVLGQSPVYEARVLVSQGVEDVASPPVPCAAFEAFCNCVACHAKDGLDCTPCPTLDP